VARVTAVIGWAQLAELDSGAALCTLFCVNTTRWSPHDQRVNVWSKRGRKGAAPVVRASAVSARALLRALPFALCCPSLRASASLCQRSRFNLRNLTDPRPGLLSHLAALSLLQPQTQTVSPSSPSVVVAVTAFVSDVVLARLATPSAAPPECRLLTTNNNHVCPSVIHSMRLEVAQLPACISIHPRNQDDRKRVERREKKTQAGATDKQRGLFLCPLSADYTSYSPEEPRKPCPRKERLARARPPPPQSLRRSASTVRPLTIVVRLLI
jgi:hypothetical protein